jgi:hypothetical protein
MTGARRIGKDVEGSSHGITLRYYLSICLEGLRKTMKTLVRIASLWAEI